MARMNCCDARQLPRQLGQQRQGAKGRERIAPFEVEQVLGRFGHAKGALVRAG
jgi:hypothetical protein